jgi:amidohydrolase
MSKKNLKKRVLEAIDKNAPKIIEAGLAIRKTPELGYKEFKTAAFVESIFKEHGWNYENEIAITGLKAYLKKESRPIVGVIGELDAIRCPDHPECDPVTGAIHSCGHDAQLASMIGAGIGLSESNVINELDGDVALIAVPAEEYIEIDYRRGLKEKKLIEFYGGKQEFIHLGKFKDIDICLSNHSGPMKEYKLGVGGTSNGFIGKLVRYIGRESHAGAAPSFGINALNAAMLGLMGIHAQRETFRDEDTIRVHPIITKGGEIVNNIPADVRIESFVRGKTIEAIIDANKKVNRALKAGAMAVGAEVDIDDTPGYMPKRPSPEVDKLLISNSIKVVGEDQVVVRDTHGTASSDIGDVSSIIPTSSFGMGGIEGMLHQRTYELIDKELQYVIPAKVMALTCIDLLFDGATEAKKIIKAFEPTIPQDSYTEFMHKLVEKP